jgi:prepilin-type N-terminal cleavage/methylation domain-containing protein
MQNIFFILKQRKALTLLEIMISMAILSVIAAGTLAIVINSLHSYYTVSVLNELSNNASFAMDEIVRDIQSSGVSVKLAAKAIDPNTGQNRDILVLPFSNQANEITGRPIWHGIIVYYPFRTDEDIDQIRKYVHNQELEPGIFPLSASVTSNNINVFNKNSGLICSFSRENDYERALVNYISESPVHGNINFIDSDDSVSVILFLQKPVIAIGGLSHRQISVNLNSTAVSRN